MFVYRENIYVLGARMSPFWFALSLTIAAGLATSVWSLLALFVKRTNERFLSLALGFSAGVMLYVSFVEILQKWFYELTAAYGPVHWGWLSLAWFFGGIVLIAIIDYLIPKIINPHEAYAIEEMHTQPTETQQEQIKKQKLLSMGIVTAFAIGIHNFPEWFATFIAALDDPQIGVAIAVAIAIHNIPEWVAASIPIYYATGSRRKAFWYSFVSGIAEPIGALIGYFLILQWMTPSLMGVVFAGVAGIMVFISLDELLPTAQKYGEHHLSIYGLVLGMAVMAISLQLFAI